MFIVGLQEWLKVFSFVSAWLLLDLGKCVMLCFRTAKTLEQQNFQVDGTCMSHRLYSLSNLCSSNCDLWVTNTMSFVTRLNPLCTYKTPRFAIVKQELTVIPWTCLAIGLTSVMASSYETHRIEHGRTSDNVLYDSNMGIKKFLAF